MCTDANVECISAFVVACQYVYEKTEKQYHRFPGMDMIGVDGLSGRSHCEIKNVLEKAIISVAETINATIYCRNSMLTITPDLFMDVVRSTVKLHKSNANWADYLCTLYVEMCHVSQVKVKRHSAEKKACINTLLVLQLDGLIKYTQPPTMDFARGHLRPSQLKSQE